MDHSNPVTLKYVNAHYTAVIGGEPGIRRSISDKFSFFVPNHQWIPKVRNGSWDGKIRLFNLRNNLIPTGLVTELVQFLYESGETPVIGDPETAQLVERDYSKTNHYHAFLQSLNITNNDQEITIRDYQLAAVLKRYQDKRGVIISPTGSGKSLIIYLLIRLYCHEHQPDFKFQTPEILLIVPTISLVEQMFKDCAEYSKHDPTFPNCSDLIAKIHNKVLEDDSSLQNRGVTISTWQSLYKQSAVNFENYKMVIGDEGHKFKGNSLQTLMQKCTRATMRIGTTGTIDFSDESHMTITGCFGAMEEITTYRELIEREELANLKIKVLQLNHQEPQTLSTYHDEINYIVSHEKRNRLITNLSLELKGNTLILFKFVDKHGKVIYDMIKEANQDPERVIRYISGETDVELREEARALAEENTNVVLVASQLCFATGINITELHNVILAAPTKSQINLLQSIGRSLRKTETQNTVIYDIADHINSTGRSAKRNYGMVHLEKRQEIYTMAGFPYTIYPIKV